MTAEPTSPPSARGADGSNADETNAEGRLASKIRRREVKRVVIKITGVADLLEIEGTMSTSAPI